jgi:hypothetical protein
MACQNKSYAPEEKVETHYFGAIKSRCSALPQGTQFAASSLDTTTHAEDSGVKNAKHLF